MAWVLTQQHVTRRASLEAGGPIEVEMVPRPTMGIFRTRREAQIHYCVAMEPDLTGAPPEFILRHWAVHRRSGHVGVAPWVTP